MFGKKKDYFTKHYRRRTFCTIVLFYVTFLSAFRDRDNDFHGKFSERVPKLADYRPFAPHAQVISQNEIKIKWLPTVLNQIEFRVYYELYTDDDIEYVGQDLTHVAKRLHYGDEYMFKLRVCHSVGDCSQFSTPKYQKLKDAAMETAYQSFIQSQTRLVPMIALLSFFASISLVGLCLLNYLSKQLIEIKFELSYIEKDVKLSENQSEKQVASICKEQQINQQRKSINQNNSSFDVQQNQNQKQIHSSSTSNEFISLETVNAFGGGGDDDSWQVISTKKNHRKRTRTTSQHSDDQSDAFKESNVQNAVDVEANYLTPITSTLKSPVTMDTTVVVIDNSNIFIGARETVCNAHVQIKPKHVKLRLQQLLNVAENNRKMTRGFTAGSSPPATDHVWDIYRRHGYIVDLEERRGKDEQRVDEQLHLAIYKALMELPPQTLVLVTGDGHKGKSRGESSFIGCAIKAIQFGWKVEVLSWKHSLSTEWSKLAARNLETMKIIYLDKFIDTLTQIERRSSKRKPEDGPN